MTSSPSRVPRQWAVALRTALTALLVASSATIAAPQPAAGELRRMEPADLQRLRPIWLSSLSPDGRHVALVVGRDSTIRSGYVGARDEFGLMCDVLVVPTAGGRAINLTRGDSDGGTSWLLRWSPSGTRLAATTTKGGTDRVRLLTWTVGHTTAVLGDDAVYTETRARRFGEGETGPVAWLNDDDLVYVAVPLGHDATTVQIAPEAWRRSLAGREPTASVLESGTAGRRPPARWSALRKLHVPTGRAVTLAGIPPEYQRQTAVSLHVSPTGRHVAVIGDIGPNPIPATVAMTADNERRRRIGIVAVDGAESNAMVTWADSIAGPRESTLRWSPDGTRVSVFGTAVPVGAVSDSVAAPTSVFLLNTDQRVRSLPLEGRRASAVEWADVNRLLVLMRPASGESPDAARQDWWLLGAEDGRSTLLTASLPAVPASVLPLEDGRYVGLAAGAWVALGVSGAETLTGDARLRSIAWPRPGGVARGNTLLAEAEGVPAEGLQRPATGRFYRVDIDGSHVRALLVDRPAESRLVGVHRFADGTAVTVFSGATSAASHLWAARNDGAATPIFTNNEFIAAIESGERRLIEFRNGDGVLTKAALLLPPGYREGTRVPMLVWPYGGTTVTSTSVLQGKSSAAVYNNELIAARGVAVLVPSVPMSPNGSPTGEPVIEIARSVLPAVDRAVELGIADPQRLAIGGNSYGAYATWAVLTQTTRFRAAIAADGDANLFTSYTSFGGAERYSDAIAETREGIWWAEASQGRMGHTPWRDVQRYLRNSPFFALDRITTPVLIVHGDLDYVPIAHAEQMFVGLSRLGKTVRFVRYFGERHGTHSPANLQDLWAQIYRWLDEYLLADSPQAAVVPERKALTVAPRW